MDLNLPKIGFDDDTEHDEEQNFLTDSVRTHYFKYMVKIINEVFLDPGKGEASDDVHKIAEYLELKAVRSCMVMDLYRKSILKTVSNLYKI